MIGSYLKTSSRTLVRNKLFSAINIVGLAVSMSVGLLVISLIHDFTSYDDFHTNHDKIFRVITNDRNDERGEITLASTSAKAGLRLKESTTGIDEVTILRRGFSGEANIGERKLPLNGIWADENFLNVFSFPLIRGNARTALREPNSIVMTEASAKKLFGDREALGRPVLFDSVEYIVTGILKDIPKLSHLRFESVVSFATLAQGGTDSDGDIFDWGNIYMNYVYFTLNDDGSRSSLEATLAKISDEENKVLKGREINLGVESLNEVVLGKNIGNPIGPTMNIIAVYVLIGLAVIIIVSACFNYTNLSIARSLRRSKEVGIRKVVGARKGNVVTQFIVEAILMSLLGLCFSFVIFLFLRQAFLDLTPFLSDIVSLELSTRLILYFVALAVAIGFVAGIAPALFFSKINAIQVLKDAKGMKMFTRVSMRKALIVVQYTFSLMFITATIIGYNQYCGFIDFDLGFKTENIFNISLKGSKGELLKRELESIPEVTGISKSVMITSLGSIHGMQVKYKATNDSADVWLNYVDEHYLPIHEHTFLAGKNFTPRSDGSETEVIVNEELLKRFGMNGDPKDVIGTELEIDNRQVSIVGVVKDFHYGTMEDKIQPMMFRYTNDHAQYLNVRIATGDIASTMKKIETAWSKIDDVSPMDGAFYDDQIENAYAQFSVMVKVIGFLGFLAIVIASMGLFGMVVFTTETRLKEISIRKVLGASETKLVFLLSGGFLLLLAVSAAIAFPLTYLFFDQVVLSNFVYHSPISLTGIIVGFFVVMAFAFLMIGSQTLKAARSNPANVLKVE